MPELYILFEKSNSTIGRLGRLVMPYPYTHVTISFDGETYYSFSRRRYHDPFDAGFTEEKLAYFAYEETEVKIYRLDISEEEKKRIEALMDKVKDCPFDVADMITMPLLHGHKRKNAYNCMSFVADVLEILEYPLPQGKYKNNIEDIENALKAKGLQGDVVTLSPRTDEVYMRKVSITQQIRSFCRLFYKLYLKKE